MIDFVNITKRIINTKFKFPYSIIKPFSKLMITKNSKQSPATLYLLNAKNVTKFEEQRKSARLSFNKKKSSRSISQYQKWNPAKQSAPLPFQPVTRTNSEIKRIVLSKNQFGLESLPIEKRVSDILEIFGSGKTRLVTQPAQLQHRPKQREQRSGQISILSLKEQTKHTRTKSHMRTQSMPNPIQQQYGSQIQLTLSRIQSKFKQYEQHSEQCKLRYMPGDGDYMLDEMVKIFKSMINQLVVQFRNVVVKNVQECQKAVLTVANQYQSEIEKMKEEMKRMDRIKHVMGCLVQEMNEKHQKNLINTIVWEDIQKRGTDLEQLIRQSPCYSKIINFDQSKPYITFSDVSSLTKQSHRILHNQQIDHSSSCHQQQHQDFVQDQNWNDNFQNNQGIKGVLKYIHNHNAKEQNRKNLNSTGEIKQKNSDMKIQNWKSFQKNQKSISNFKKILSQR